MELILNLTATVLVLGEAARVLISVYRRPYCCGWDRKWMLSWMVTQVSVAVILYAVWR